jgi:uncharacterized membrane protein YfcA
MDPAIVLFGLGVGVGVLVGTTGMGGGSLMTPLLILVFGVKPVVAVGTDLSYAAVTKTVGGWRHWRAGTVDSRLAFWLAVGSCPAALAGVYVLNLLRDVYGDGFNDFLIISIAGALLLTGALVLLRALVLTGSGERAELELQTRHKVAAVALGASIGFVLGVTSAGSGTLIGSIPGVWIGSSLAVRLPERGLRPALGVVLLTSGLALLTKAGVDVPAAVLVGVPVLLIVGCAATLRLRHPEVNPA